MLVLCYLYQTIRIALGFLSVALASQAQYKSSATCKFLTPNDDAAVIGAGAKLVQAIENGGCTKKQGAMTLTVAQPSTLSNHKALEMGFEAFAREDSKPLSGIGDKARIKKGNSGYQIMFLKGNTMAGVEVYGEGSDSTQMADKLVEAAKKIATKL